jgi:hypothetical protein
MTELAKRHNIGMALQLVFIVHSERGRGGLTEDQLYFQIESESYKK